MSIWSGLVGPGVVAAAVTLAFNWWIQRPRTDLRMIRSGFTVTDLERLKRAKEKASDTALQWQPWHVVRLTNYGDGTGYDIKLTGTNCRPRVWVDDGGIEVPMPTYAPPPPPQTTLRPRSRKLFRPKNGRCGATPSVRLCRASWCMTVGAACRVAVSGWRRASMSRAPSDPMSAPF
jgi:hypothetical protein